MSNLSNLDIDRLKVLAENGDTEVAYTLGIMYKNGEIPTLFKHKKAFYFFEIAAKQGHNHAQELLGNMYFLGYGTKKNLDKYIFWLTCAYLNGNKNVIQFLNDYIAHIPSGRRKIDSTIENIKQNYPFYIKK